MSICTPADSALQGDKIHHLDGGKFDLQPNGLLVAIPSPQRVNKAFRYDHVVVELQLDQSEKGEGQCFDDGYKMVKFISHYRYFSARS